MFKTFTVIILCTVPCFSFSKKKKIPVNDQKEIKRFAMINSNLKIRVLSNSCM